MANCPVEKVRNFVLAGHAGSGKTTLSELILLKGGEIPRLGSVQAGTTVSDYQKAEQERQSSIFASLLHAPWKDGHFFFADTPGNFDFCGRAINVIGIADLLVLVIDAEAGIGAGTIRAWKQAVARKMPMIFFINGCDREQSKYGQIVEALCDYHGKTKVIPCTLPDAEGAKFKAVKSVLADDADGDAADYKSSLMDAVAEADEALMEKYLDAGELSADELCAGFHTALRKGDLYPVFAGSAAKDIGVTELLDAILAYGPTPVEDVSLDLAKGTLDRASSDTTGIVFMSYSDPVIGQMNYIRVLSGQFTTNSELINLRAGAKERIGTLLQVQGKNTVAVDSVGPGEFVALAKLKSTVLDDILSSKQMDLAYAGNTYPQATTIFAISPAKKGEEDKMAQALQRLCNENQTIQVERNKETKETLLHLMGDQQLSFVIGRLKNESKLEVELSTPRIPYRETINSTGTASYRHKKQTGGHGQFAEVHMRLEPFQPTEGGPDYEFANEVVGGNIPKNFIPAVEKGVAETRLAGPLSGSLVINFRAVVFDGKYHPVDSSEMAFKLATRHAFRDAMDQAKPQLLEPIYALDITAPQEYMGAISGDLNTRRGRILGMDTEAGLQVVHAEVPLAEVYSYPPVLRSMTQGRGVFEMRFERYETVPKAIAEKIRAAMAAQTDEDEE